MFVLGLRPFGPLELFTVDPTVNVFFFFCLTRVDRVLDFGPSPQPTDPVLGDGSQEGGALLRPRVTIPRQHPHRLFVLVL